MEDLIAKYVGRFWGPDKITSIALTEFKTPSGKATFEITTLKQKNNVPFDETTLVTENALAEFSSTEAVDYTSFLTAKLNTLIPKVMDVLKEYDLGVTEFEAFERSLKASFEMRFQRALTYLFFQDDNRFIPGWDVKNDVSLMLTERVISRIPKKNGDE